MLEQNSLLTENLPIADGMDVLCRTGLDALRRLDGNESGASDWRRQADAAVEKYNHQRVGDMLIGIAPGVQKLVDAVGR